MLNAFSLTCCDILNRHAPRRKRYLRVNRNKPFISCKISRGIMTMKKLHDRYLKSKSEENRETNVFHFHEIRKKNTSPLWMKMKLQVTKHSGRLKPFLSNNAFSAQRIFLNPFFPNAPFQSYSFLMFSVGRKRVHWEQMG